jgi:uncharacterized protein YcaQ
MIISKKQAKSFILKSQLLLNNDNESTLNIIRKLGYVQIDTISVVQRAHHHILWSRNSNYKTTDLNKLLKNNKIFEYWSHAASYLPIEDYRFYLLKMNEYKKGKSHWFKKDLKVQRYVLDMIKNEGPKMSKDFKSNKKTTGWFDWKPTKRALEQLYMSGDLMVRERKGFQKVYDLKENILLNKIDQTLPSELEYAEYLIRRQLNALGIASINEISYMINASRKKNVKAVLEKMIEMKEVSNISIRGLYGDYFTLTKNLKKILIKTNENKISILSPFDNLVIQRKRLKELFDFDFQLECYLPASKRKYGYFSLPILYGTKFIGRIDMKANRKESSLMNIKTYWEKGFKLNRDELQSELKRFALFNDCIHVKL